MSTELNIASAARTAPVGPTVTATKTAAPQPRQSKPADTAPPPPRVDPTQLMRDLQEAVQKINEEMKKNGRELNFSVDKVLDYPVVTVKNSTTGEVIRQFPNEATVRVAHNLAGLKGLFHNKSA